MRDHRLMLAIVGSLAAASCVTVPGNEVQEWNSATLGDGGTSDFYRYGAALPDVPGVLLRQEPLSDRQAIDAAATNLRLLYSSTDGLTGSGAVAVSGVLYLPQGDAPQGGWPLMGWTHGTVGIADICAPSWDGRQQQDVDYLSYYLSRGFAIVASDYQGLGTPGTHPYLATRPEAYSNLDIIRAVQRAGFPVSSDVVLFGQSQGAGAAIATAAYAGEYASEIGIKGVVATGVPYFSPAALVALNESRPADRPDPLLGYNFLAMTLAEQTEPGFSMREHISQDAWPIASKVTDTCYKDIRQDVVDAGLSYNSAFSKSPSEVLVRTFARMGFPKLDLPAPLFLGTGGKDRDTPRRMQAAFMRDTCAAGTVVQAHLYPDLDHRQVVPGSTGDSLPFVRAAFAGDTIKGNCDASPLE